MTDRRAAWKNRGGERPAFAIAPGPGQESVWDYPRPPRIEPEPRRVEVRVGDCPIALTSGAVRVLETASPPTVYVPPDDVRWSFIEASTARTHCEWKGLARYWDVVVSGERIEQAGWSYPEPHPEFEPIRDFVAFYPGRVACWLGGVRVDPQPGRFYGGWVTPDVVGPFKGEPGTEGW